MKVLYQKITLCITFIIFISVHSYASKIIFECRYICIDSLSMNDISRHVNLDLRTKSISILIDNRLIEFAQKYEIDTSSFKPQYLVNEFEGVWIFLHTTELISVDNDSIYVLATYTRFNEKHNISRPCKMKLSICKSGLLGVVVSPTIKEMKKKRRTFLLFWGSLAALSVVFMVIGGG